MEGLTRDVARASGFSGRGIAYVRAISAAPSLLRPPKVTKGLGAVIGFEDEIHAARDATKTHASRVGNFCVGRTWKAWRDWRGGDRVAADHTLVVVASRSPQGRVAPAYTLGDFGNPPNP